MFTDRNRAIRERQMSHDLYRSGLDHYSGEYDETAMSWLLVTKEPSDLFLYFIVAPYAIAM